MKTLCPKLFFLFYTSLLFAQKETLISGKIIDSKSQSPLISVVVTIQNTNQMQLSAADGKFQFKTNLQGDQLVLFHNQGYKDKLIAVQIQENKLIDLGIIVLEEEDEVNQQGAVISILDDDLDENNGGSESTSGLLQASKDAFQQAAAFNWGQSRFRVRGLDSQYAQLLINGLTMNKAYDGRPQWGDWGGLNDVLRNQEIAIGSSPSDYAFGGILGTQHLSTQASTYKKGTRIAFSGTNTNYQGRAMVTYASGMNEKGWAFVVSAGKRYANEGYFEGTNYDANSIFTSVEKKISPRNSINFTAFYTPNSRGKNSPNTDEVVSLTSEKYNSYWGFQNGKQRNSRIKYIEEPVFMLNDYFKINATTQLNLGAFYQFGKISNSNIDYQHANSPDPSYYRKMPSYFSSLYAKDEGEFSGAFTPDLANAERSKTLFLSQPQINWAAMYQANQNPIVDANGKITEFEPAQSKYILYEDRTDDKNLAFSALLNTELTEDIRLNAGASFNKLHSHNYQNVLDLLGGLYFEDVDVFYKGDQAESDLNNPNRQVKVGDTYGYNFNLMSAKLEGFTQFQFRYKKVDFYLAQEYSSSTYQREGLYKNGIYPTNSFGESPTLHFENFGFKGGLTWKLSGKQLLLFNGSHASKAPNLKAVFPNSRLNNSIVDGIESENNSSLDASYVYRSPKLKMRFTGYFSQIKNATETSFFYAEGIFDNGAGNNSTNAFVSQTLTHLDKKNWGTELSFEYQINPTLKTIVAAAFGEYIYASNPNVTITNDAKASVENTNPVFNFGTAALKNYHQAGTPQQAYSLGLEYRNPKYWWLSTNVNYLAKNYIDISPIARTSNFFINPASGFPFPEATEERGRELLKQEELTPLLLLNLVGGKSWRIFKKNLNLFCSINNLLDTSFKTGGYEQARNANFRQRNQDITSGTPNFGNKYFYGYGRTYFVSLSINF
ncbi:MULTISPECIES: TonB-dependent receptor [Flavobacterium]|uniref:TonB-dependent receptor n=1 Tax=Flavobacterium keumense TaxID=1306518 RepID=A0ABY8N702_9FLAO|nr:MULTISPECIES: TonB-dependent receptor [Flavobacterium]WGK95164.1 TonB-dependent receptor [Flavobacterium keumense]